MQKTETKTQTPRRQPDPFLYHAVVRKEYLYQEGGKSAAANDDNVQTEVRTEVLTAERRGELKEKLGDPAVVQIVAIFRGRQVKFNERRNVQLA
jgi:hypothetical protein